MLSWISKLDSIINDKKTILCVGLDPQYELIKKIGFKDLYEWGCAVIDSTKDFVCAYKFQLAFYELSGIKGLQEMQKTIDYAKSLGLILIGDGKRGDIGSTAEAYSDAMFNTWGFDVVTVNPYMGFDSMKPFLEIDGKGAFVVCRSSNNSASQIQDILVKSEGSEIKLYEYIYNIVRKNDHENNAGLVLGATNIDPIKVIRSLDDEIPLLIPGIGTQGGVIEEVVPVSLSKTHNGRCVFPISRAIIFPRSSYNNLEDYLSLIYKEAELFSNRMKVYLTS